MSRATLRARALVLLLLALAVLVVITGNALATWSGQAGPWPNSGIFVTDVSGTSGSVTIPMPASDVALSLRVGCTIRATASGSGVSVDDSAFTSTMFLATNVGGTPSTSFSSVSLGKIYSSSLSTVGAPSLAVSGQSIIVTCPGPDLAGVTYDVRTEAQWAAN
jgi:hypothetical protein